MALRAVPPMRPRGRYWGKTGRASLRLARQKMTDTVEKGVALIGEQ
jgi:hypothetical protein